MTYEEYLEKNNTLTYTNVGVSMMPLLRQGRDLFTVTKKTGRRCKAGDVVLYRRPPNKYVLHRIIAVRPNDYVILGDNCIGREYGIKDKSVKKMACIILGFRISKTQQLSNWEAEVLSEAQKRYAATDAWVCREMYLKLLASEKNPLDAEELMPPPQPPQPAAEAKPETNGKNRPKKK